MYASQRKPGIVVLCTIHLLYDRDNETNTERAETTGKSVMAYAPQQGAATQGENNGKERAVQQSALGTTANPAPEWRMALSTYTHCSAGAILWQW